MKSFDRQEPAPFEPFGIGLSIGDVYEIRHPEAAWLTRGGLYIGLPSSQDMLERAVNGALLHIAAIETLPLRSY